jgi:hypothetical protein
MKIIFRRMPGMTIIYIHLYIYLFIILQFFIIFFIYYSIFLLELWEGYGEHLVWEALFKCICSGIVCGIFW